MYSTGAIAGLDAGVMATPRAGQCFKFTGKIRTMFNQINPHHFSCLYKMTFERHAIKALRCCDDSRVDRLLPCRRHRRAGDNAAWSDGATATESSSGDECTPILTTEAAFKPRSFNVSIFDRLQMNVGLLSESDSDVSRIAVGLVSRAILTFSKYCLNPQKVETFVMQHLELDQSQASNSGQGQGVIPLVLGLRVNVRVMVRYVASTNRRPLLSRSM